MTIVLLAPIFLLALVVTSHPLLSSAVQDLGDFAPAASTFQTNVQAAFRVHSGKGDGKLDAARFYSQKPTQHTEYLSELGAENFAPSASLETSPETLPLLDAHLDEATYKQDIDDEVALVEEEPTFLGLAIDEQDPIDESSSSLLLVLAVSCVTAFLVLVCVGLTYIVKSLRSQVLASKTVWGLLPRLWRKPSSQGVSARVALLGRRHPAVQAGCLIDAEEGSAQRYYVRLGGKSLGLNAVSDVESDWDDIDEKYQDALDMTPLLPTHDLPPEDVTQPSHFDDPPLLSLEPCLSDQPITERSMPLREVCSPIPRPTWSIRAMDSPALGLSSRVHDHGTTPDLLTSPHCRAYRLPVPEFDIALAMQLRPGLGIGADSAWMVRFLMAIFGWFAVALTSNK